jgi:hypothetical protein
MKPAIDPIANLTRTLAEVDLEAKTAEHDYRRTLQDGADHMASRYPASTLQGRPQDLEHWSWHQESMQAAIEKGGLGEVPALPFQPVNGNLSSQNPDGPDVKRNQSES